MTVHAWKDYSAWDWLISACLAYWAWRFAIWFSWLHELGHAVLGLGYVLDWTAAVVTVDWFGSRIGGLVVPIVVYGVAGRLMRKLMPPLPAFSAMLAILIESWDLWGDYPVHSEFHIAVGLAVLAVCAYSICKPGRPSRTWPRLVRFIRDAMGREKV